MVLLPVLAKAGLKAPVDALVIPAPLHVPPVCAAVNTTGVASAQ